jgi:hypothetical protein
MAYTITLYNVDLLLFMIGWFILSWIIYKTGKTIKRSIGKLILKLEKKGVL